jgi:hypothetical protein
MYTKRNLSKNRVLSVNIVYVSNSNVALPQGLTLRLEECAFNVGAASASAARGIMETVIGQVKSTR